MFTNDPKFLDELSPQQRTFVDSFSTLITGTGLFIEAGLSKTKEGVLILYAIPRWIFKDMTENISETTTFMYSVELPFDKYVFSNEEMRKNIHDLTIQFLQHYCKGKREILVEYNQQTLDEITKKQRQQVFNEQDQTISEQTVA